MRGQGASAANVLSLLEGSAINESHRWCDKVQDAYSLRCAPQVHGASRDLFDYIDYTVSVELNAATDNPLVLVEVDMLVSNGNFHGQPLAFALDALAMAAAELANISERRVERLVNPSLSGGLPPFLTTDGGLNSGFMIPQYVAASLVSENKVLAHPASVDSIPTSAGQEDHVSMGNAAGLKAWQVLANVEWALAIELLAGVQGVEFLAPLEPGCGVVAARSFVRELSPRLTDDRPLGADIDAVAGAIRDGSLVAAVEGEIGALRVSTTETLAATVEALCGDLSSIRAPRGPELNARSWSTEAPLRMLLNNLDHEVGERPEDLVVYGGTGRAARSHEALKAIVGTLLRLGDDETLLVQSGKPVGVFRTHPGAPRVLIANAMLVPRWATWDEFRRLEALGLTMYGQMTAGSWIYIGTQGILQGTYQTFAAAAEQHFGATDLAGRTILTAGLGGMGGAQPLAGVDAERGDALRRGRPGPDRAAARAPVPRRGDRVSRRRARARARRAAGGTGRSRWACSATRQKSSRSLPGGASTSTWSPTRPRRTTR